MRSRLRVVAMAVGAVAAVGCAGQQVSTDYSPSAAFSGYHTFAIVSRPDSASHQLLDDRVRSALEAQLPAKGLTETDRESADLYVGYGVVDRTHKEVHAQGSVHHRHRVGMGRWLGMAFVPLGRGLAGRPPAQRRDVHRRHGSHLPGRCQDQARGLARSGRRRAQSASQRPNEGHEEH